MGKFFLIPVIILLNLAGKVYYSGNVNVEVKGSSFCGEQELRSFSDSQLLYNGRIRYPMYLNIYGNEFFPTPSWLKGDVVIGGFSFKNLDLRFDIFNDELLIKRSDLVVIVLNKEKIREFTLYYNGISYRFLNFGENNNSQLKGFANIFHEGKIEILFKPVKVVYPQAYRNAYDMFVQNNRLYTYSDGKIVRLYNENDFINCMKDKREVIRNYMKRNRIIFNTDEPENLLPVLKLYEVVSVN